MIDSPLDQKIITLTKIIVIAITIICFRLLYLQIHLASYFFSKSQKNFLRTDNIASPRGNIIDCTGELLATNRPLINIYWHGTGKGSLSNYQLQLIDNIKNLLGIRFDNQLMMNIKHAEKRRGEILLASDISFELLSKISEQCAQHPNIYAEKKFERYYPHGPLASHILGYLSTIDFESMGKMGIESIFDSSLKGSRGTLITTINSLGIRLEQKELSPALSGQTIETTLDTQLQKIAESVFLPDQVGTLILMDPACGDIKALVSKPSFDPALFLKPLNGTQWRELQDKQPFLNRAFNACYPPASIFKLISLAAALEEGIVTNETEVVCKGYVSFGSRKYGCRLRHGGHGRLDIQESIAKSCNTLFYIIGKHIDIDVLTDYAKRFGLGEKTGLIFQEKRGLMPTRSWRRKVYGEPWWPGDTLQATIGQTYLLVTPIQIAGMISSIFTGYVASPRITMQETIKRRPLQISTATRNILQEAMHAVVMEGTSRDLRPFAQKGFKLYAKTGTGQTSHLSKRNLGGKHLEHAWAAVHFKYKNEQPLTIIVLIEHAGSSYYARGCTRRFLSGYRKLKEQTEKVNL